MDKNKVTVGVDKDEKKTIITFFAGFGVGIVTLIAAFHTLEFLLH